MVTRITMTALAPYVPSPARSAEFWSAHLDALERHLSAKTWALAAITVVLVAYPIARVLIPAAIHSFVPDVVRSVLHFI
jgi:hypothetical protein